MRSSDRLARGALVVLCLLAALYGWSILSVARPESGYAGWWDGWLGNLVQLMAAALTFARGLFATERRGAWLWLGAGCGGQVAGNLVYLFHDQNLDPVPFPAPADAFYLVGYLGFVGGVLLFTHGGRKVSTTLRIDGLIVGLAIAAAAAPLAFEPALAVSGSLAEVTVGLAYPLLDLMLLILLAAGVFSLGQRPDAPTVWLSVGVLIFAGGDIAYLAAEANGTYVQGTPLDFMWAAGMVCFAVAAWSRRPPQAAAPSAAAQRALVFLPLVAAIVALVVPAMQIFADVPASATALAVTAIAAVLVRLGLSLREVSRLLVVSRQARTDELTTLPNRRGFLEQLDDALETRDRGLAVLLFDLDGFKDINDTLGHAAGDELLLGLSLRLTRRMPAGTNFARLGGDEFAAILPVASEAAAMAIADEMTRWFGEPVVLEGVPVRVGASCGIAISPIHGTERSELLRAADVAMYQAKRAHLGGAVVYETERDPHDRDRLQLIDELRDALDRQAFELHYQPQVSFVDGRVTGVEALVRWPHPTLGLLAPAAFLPLLEQIGMLPRLTRIVVNQAISFAAHEAGPDGWSVSVNVSAQDLLDDGLPGVVVDALTTNGFDGRRLVLEITEDAIVRDPQRARRLLEPLRALGVGIAVDDFGTGYQSLGQLLALDLDEVKLDRSLVADVAENPRSQAVVEAMASLSRSLGLRLVAEGVEHLGALRHLGRLGCTTAQGFLVGHPVPGLELAAEIDRINADGIARQPLAPAGSAPH